MRRVLLVDDDAAFLDTLALLLAYDPAFEVVGRATDGVEAVRLVDELRPDVVTMDIDMPRMDGVEAIRAIAERRPETCVVVVTACDSSGRIGEARTAGASHEILKSGTLSDLPAAIHAACPLGAAVL